MKKIAGFGILATAAAVIIYALTRPAGGDDEPVVDMTLTWGEN